MEEDIVYNRTSKEESLKAYINDRLKSAISDAEERQKYEAAHNPDILLALRVVRDFIIRKMRVCYGGTAMNAILPDSKKFYSPDLDLPDYDFFTPDAETDIVELMADLDRAGFNEIYHKVGIHEGTTKVMVNFIPVADVTQISRGIYDVYYNRAIIIDGMHFTDPDMLRMMMYLEISRPRGQVMRWEKVFERLRLINETFPIDSADCKPVKNMDLEQGVARSVYDFAIDNQRVICSESLIPLYARGIRLANSALDIKISGGPIIFISPNPKEDAEQIKRRIDDCKLYLYKEKEDTVPLRIEIRRNGKPIALVIKEHACHAYYQIPTTDGRIAVIGSIEFLITLYLNLHIFTKSAPFFTKGIMCVVRNLIALSNKNYVADKSQFAPFASLCKGYQIGFASLLRKKMNRLKEQKGKTRRRRAISRKARKE
jgi:hypothetical protein